MSHFKAKRHQIRFPASVRASVRFKLYLRVKTHGVENRRRFSTPKTDMAEKSDDDAVAAAIMHSYSCKS